MEPRRGDGLGILSTVEAGSRLVVTQRNVWKIRCCRVTFVERATRRTGDEHVRVCQVGRGTVKMGFGSGSSQMRI